jgi:hypothetical protein
MFNIIGITLNCVRGGHKWWICMDFEGSNYSLLEGMISKLLLQNSLKSQETLVTIGISQIKVQSQNFQNTRIQCKDCSSVGITTWRWMMQLSLKRGHPFTALNDVTLQKFSYCYENTKSHISRLTLWTQLLGLRATMAYYCPNVNVPLVVVVIP